MTLIDEALAGRSLAALARHLGWSLAALSRYRAGVSLPPRARIVALAEALRMDPDVLLTQWAHQPRVGALIERARAWGVSPVEVLGLVELFSGADRRITRGGRDATTGD